MSPSSTVPSDHATEFVTLRRVRFAYSMAGSGPVVLSAHGLTSSRANDARTGLAEFDPVAAAGRTLVSYDARGHGETEGTGDPGDYTWSALADDLRALADHFSPDAPVSAIGSSMGTGTLLHAVTRRPDRFDRLVLTAPPTAWQTRAGQGAIYRQMADTVETSTPAQLAAAFDEGPVAPVFADTAGFPPPDIAPALMPTVFRGAASTDLPPLDLIAGIAQPTLVLAWATDPGHPVSTAEALAGAITGSTLHVSETSADIRTWGARAADFLRR